MVWRRRRLFLRAGRKVLMGTKSYTWIKPGIWGAVIGVVGITIVGFWAFGWVLGSKAEQMAVDRANDAVAIALGPACVAKFQAQADAPAKLAELKKLTTDYAQRDFVEKGGWATVVDSKVSTYRLTAECTRQLLAAKSA
jgi:hypothetical protein